MDRWLPFAELAGSRDNRGVTPSHTAKSERKIALLGELRRVLRNSGKFYVADFDAPIAPREGTMLRGLSL